ncbi:hypothetical protein GC209_04905 [bacterium]|nr:hypothetical protein [bacterium]
MGLIGHNGGPSVAPGESWRRHCWTAARAALLPTLPIEVLRSRVSRARDLGLDYKTYASVRAATGHDVVAFLFSSNALRIAPNRPTMAPDRAEKLARLTACQRLGLAQGLAPGLILAANAEVLDAAHPAPSPFASFRQSHAALRAALAHIPGDRVLLVGDTGLEREWCAAGRLAGYLPAERYFSAN